MVTTVDGKCGRERYGFYFRFGQVLPEVIDENKFERDFLYFAFVMIV